MEELPGSLVALMAHPDDETFRCGGLLAKLACTGVRVHLVTATRGEAGLPLGGDLRLREGELRCACAALGIATPLILGYPDGGLQATSAREAVRLLLPEVLAWQPAVLLTWPPHGLSGHPDHVAVSLWADLLYDEVLAASDRPVALYHLAVPRSLAERLGLRQLRADPDERITLAFDVGELYERKRSAIDCHRSQWASTPILAAEPDAQRLFLGFEHLIRARGDPRRDPLPRWLGLQAPAAPPPRGG